ncbi:transposase [Streptomyces sp. NPDC005303]|uniref:transposase n=1 Tax=Streptomyces sp. NPDC005303 TaxID=3155713 RepID=UPI0033B7FB37
MSAPEREAGPPHPGRHRQQPAVPHARQVQRIQRKRRAAGQKRQRTVYAITDLLAEQATAPEIASWARSHWTVENTVHCCRDVTFGEDASQVRHHHTPAVLRDLIRSCLKLAHDHELRHPA